LDKQLEIVEEHPDLWSNSPCKNCKARAICVTEIRRPTYWPPCFKASRHYDVEIARTAQRWGWERGKRDGASLADLPMFAKETV
jgi:hypothetical protein